MNKEKLPAKHAMKREERKGTITLVNGASGFRVMIKKTFAFFALLSVLCGRPIPLKTASNSLLLQLHSTQDQR